MIRTEYYIDENIPHFAAFIDELVLVRRVDLKILRMWISYWLHDFKHKVWHSIKSQTRKTLQNQRLY
jgi:hypothetical protein